LTVACYWANGTKIDLPGSGGGTACSICVSAGTVYVAGYYNDGTAEVACYWANGTKTDLPGSAPSAAYSIYVSGGSVYVAGYYNDTWDVGCYWMNSSEEELRINVRGPVAYSIFVP
jgi:hypothetical protein